MTTATATPRPDCFPVYCEPGTACPRHRPAPTCPECGRPARGSAFGVTDLYLRCSLGHVFINLTSQEG